MEGAGSVVTTRQGRMIACVRGFEPTAKFVWALRDRPESKCVVIALDADQVKIKVVDLVRHRGKMDGAKLEECLVPAVFFEFDQFGAIALSVDVPDGGDVLFLGGGVLGSSGKKEVAANAF